MFLGRIEFLSFIFTIFKLSLLKKISVGSSEKLMGTDRQDAKLIGDY